MKKHPISIMLDSGAFTAWRKDEKLSVKKYTAFIKKFQHLLQSYVSLDTIPGTSGLMKKTKEEVEDSAARSYFNHQWMKDAGLSPIPVFHQGEKFTWLETMLEEGEPYIGISPYLRAPHEQQQSWLDECFDLITDSSGRPVVNTHGFGGANPKYLRRYPWTSADSSSWSIDAGHGHILVPPMTDEKFRYDLKATHIPVTGISKEAYSQSRHFEVLGPNEQDRVLKFLKDEIGITIGQARNDQQARMRAYLIYTQKMVEAICCMTFQYKRSKFIHPVVKRSPIKYQPVKMVFATSMNGAFSKSLNEVGANFRLLSYYEIRDIPIETLEAYVKTGMPPDYKQRPSKTDWTSQGYKKRRRLALAERMTNEKSFTCSQCGTEGIAENVCTVCDTLPPW